MEPFADPAILWPPPLPAPRRGRLGWLGHLSLLTTWLLVLIVFGHRQMASGKHVPLGSVRGVLWAVGTELVIFGPVCALAWLCSRATADEWRLRWRGGVGPVWRGVLYSVGFRVALFVGLFLVVVALVALHVVTAQQMRGFRPQVENLVSTDALAHDRAFYWCALVLLSPMAGVVEEIWRGGMLAGLAGVFPRVFGGPAGQWAAVLPVALLFGLGHLYMGWPAVVLTTLLGLALGAIMVAHRTIWDAAIAHALFDAGSFALLAWAAQKNPHLLGQ